MSLGVPEDPEDPGRPGKRRQSVLRKEDLRGRGICQPGKNPPQHERKAGARLLAEADPDGRVSERCLC